jgi:malonyl-CoA O-methyltransferase
MSLTELDRIAISRGFDQAAKEYDEHAVLQHEVEQRLLERLEFLRDEPARILDVGCGTGIACHSLKSQFPDALVIGLDWSAAMLRGLQNRLDGDSGPLAVCADMHAMPMPARSFDLVISNLALQWSNRLETVFENVRSLLRPGGMFVFTSFGPDTLHELRSAWAQADNEPHVHEFIDMHDLGDMMVAAGFIEPVMDMEMLTLEYRSVMALMRELKAIGARNSAVSRSAGLTGRTKLQRVLDAYEQFQRNGRYPASYEVIYGAAFGPAEGQPFRTAQGETATFSVEALRAGRKGGVE